MWIRKYIEYFKTREENIASIIIQEVKTISHSFSIVVVLLGGIFFYGLLYNLMYAPNLVRKIPISVVDNSQSELSRKFIRMIDATPSISVIATDVGYPDAKELMKRNETEGIIYIPYDFEDKVSRGEQSIFITYQSTTAFLYAAALSEAASSTMLAMGTDFRPNMLVFMNNPKAIELSYPETIQVAGHALYNPTDGYGTYLIPGVMIVIIFQTLMMLIGMITGTERSSGSIVRFAGNRHNISFVHMAELVLSKTFVYSMLYAIFSFFLLGLMPLVFGLPDIGNVFNIVIMMIPFIMATCFFGFACSVFFSDDDSSILLIAFGSVVLIFLSGISYPLELMPWYWKVAHFLIPSGPATLGFVQLNSMGASLYDIWPLMLALWIQCAVFFVLACLAYRHNIIKSLRDQHLCPEDTSLSNITLKERITNRIGYLRDIARGNK